MRSLEARLIPEPVRIVGAKEEAREVKTFELEEEGRVPRIAETAKPGNFVLIWVPRPADGRVDIELPDMVPMSISDADGGRFKLTVKAYGPTTAELLQYREGMMLGAVGPLGNAFRLEQGGRSLAVAGGIGVAPFVFLVKGARRMGQSVTVLLGAKTADKLVFERALAEAADKIVVVTDDGSRGVKALVSEFMETHLIADGFDRIFCCGPEPMMASVLRLIAAKGVPGQFSLERHMYCGCGGCGSCTIDGRRVCKDGPVFDSSELLLMPSFGKRSRTAEGTPIQLAAG